MASEKHHLMVLVLHIKGKSNSLEKLKIWVVCTALGKSHWVCMQPSKSNVISRGHFQPEILYNFTDFNPTGPPILSNCTA